MTTPSARFLQPSHPGNRSIQFRAMLAAVLLIMIIGPFLAGCSAVEAYLPTGPTPAPTAAPAAGIATAVPLPPPPKTEVTFVALAPENTPAGETVYLTVLDEVTGLALNAQPHAMYLIGEPGVGPQFFYLTIPFTVGAVVQYHYERGAGDSTVAEHTSDGRPVRYRLHAVDGPGVVQDVISRWTDTPFISDSGRIMGQVTDNETGQPIPDILVAAGGAQTRTASDGSFLIEGLPPGVHNLVAYAPDGSYRTYQQGAEVAAQATTPAPLHLQAAPLVNMIFVVSLPNDTPPAVPVRMAGNLFQLGNTFANLAGGVSTLAARMPVLSLLPDGRQTLTLALPAGAYLRYKYTLGDGFWNAEHDEENSFVLREVVVPEESGLIEDTVVTWRSSSQEPLTFDLQVPSGTPAGDVISIQFNPLFGWTEPVPMWRLADNRWAYILFSPLNLPGDLLYRYCRNDQCPRAGEVAEGGDPIRKAAAGAERQMIKDQVHAWASWQPDSNTGVVSATLTAPAEITAQAGFIAGIEFRDTYQPAWQPYLPQAIEDVRSTGANWLFLRPSWSYLQQPLPILAPVAGADPSWYEMTDMIEQAQLRGLNVAINPAVHFPEEMDAWWQEADRDQAWWQVWFEQYRTFMIHHADLARLSGAPALIMGGEWLAPALPGGVLADGSPSGVPEDAEERWRSLIAEVRSRYPGVVAWEIASTRIQKTPAFLNLLDLIYLQWSAPLAAAPDSPRLALETEMVRILDLVVQPIHYLTGKPVVLAVAYPSALNALTGCVPDAQGNCLLIQSMDPSDQALANAPVDFQAQALGYDILLHAASQRPWIGGFVARGYDPPVALQDGTFSLHGKPAEQILLPWFNLLAPQVVP